MREYHGKQILKVYSTLDINGNKILKVFYTDNTTEIVRGGERRQTSAQGSWAALLIVETALIDSRFSDFK